MATEIDQVKPLPPGSLDLNKKQVQDVVDDLIRTKRQLEQALNTAEDLLDEVNARLTEVEEQLPTEATQADMEAGTASDKFISPRRFKSHPLAIKAFGQVNEATLQQSYGVTSVTGSGNVDKTVTLSTAMSSSDYLILVSDAFFDFSGNDAPCISRIMSKSTTGFVVKFFSEFGGDQTPKTWSFIVMGDQ